MSTTAWDIHVHHVPATLLAAARTGRFGMRIDAEHLALPDGARLPLRRLIDLDALLAWLDRRALMGAVLSVPPALFRYDLAPDEAPAYVELVNDGLADAVRGAPRRLRAFASLPLQVASAAIDESRRRRAGGTWSGFAVGSSLPNGGALDDCALEPLYARLDADASFVFIHPVDAPDARLERFYLANLLGNPYETSFAAARLIFAGVLARHPRLRFCLAHGGGALPYLIGRFQRGHATRRPGIEPLELDPVAALRRFRFDALTHEPRALELLVALVGADRVHVGSDYPFPMGDDDPLASLASLSSSARATICAHGPPDLERDDRVAQPR